MTDHLLLQAFFGLAGFLTLVSVGVWFGQRQARYAGRDLRRPAFTAVNDE